MIFVQDVFLFFSLREDLSHHRGSGSMIGLAGCHLALTFLFFCEGPITGKKSGNVGLNPNHSSSCLSSSGNNSFAQRMM